MSWKQEYKRVKANYDENLETIRRMQEQHSLMMDLLSRREIEIEYLRDLSDEYKAKCLALEEGSTMEKEKQDGKGQ